MLYSIDEIKNRIIPIAKTYGIKSIGLFGSYARGEANDQSDIDIYIEKGRLDSLLLYFMFVDDLEKNLGCHVDVITTDISDETFLSSILSEGVPLYNE